MKIKVAHKIVAGYLVGVLLLAAFAALTFFNGKRIEATTVELSQNKLPGLISVAALKSSTQMQTNHLYELYATNDDALFEQKHQQNMVAMQKHWAELTKLKEFAQFEAQLSEMNLNQTKLVQRFSDVMLESPVDWDLARDVLAEYSQGADALSAELDKLVQSVADETLQQAANSELLTEQLINVVLALTVLSFIGLLAMIYFANKSISVPLADLSRSLADITSRRDLTARIRLFSKDEIGDIATAANNLLAEFQRLALTLDGTAQEVSRTMNTLSSVTDDTLTSTTERNKKLRVATQDFLKDIEMASSKQQIDSQLRQAQLKFIQTHLGEIDDGRLVMERNVASLQGSTSKLHLLAENMRNQIRMLNF